MKAAPVAREIPRVTWRDVVAAFHHEMKQPATRGFVLVAISVQQLAHLALSH